MIVLSICEIFGPVRLVGLRNVDHIARLQDDILAQIALGEECGEIALHLLRLAGFSCP